MLNVPALTAPAEFAGITVPSEIGATVPQSVAVGGPRSEVRGAVARAAPLPARPRHPLPVALAAAHPDGAGDWVRVDELPGRGMEAVDAAGRVWRLGAPDWVGVAPSGDRLTVACATPGGPAAWFHFDGVLRDEAGGAVGGRRCDWVGVQGV